MVRQVYVNESYLDANNIGRVRRAIGFGTHPDADPANVKVVTNAIAGPSQFFRIVMDEILVGNNLEQIACRGPVGFDENGVATAYDSVPMGTTPDDIAKCAVAVDVLRATCKGEHAVCVGADPANPVGVLDENQDGAADDSQFIQGAVTLNCSGINVPIDPTSYWQPSGTQLPPSAGGLEVLGPAIVLRPLRGLPTSSQCGISFSSKVVDKSGIQVCAPENGDITKPCTPGDTSLISFGTQAMALDGTSPANNAMMVALVATGRSYSQILVDFNVAVDIASLATATLSPVLPFTVATDPDTSKAFLRFEGGYAPSTTYTLTLPTTVTDTFGQGLPAPITLTFTTRP